MYIYIQNIVFDYLKCVNKFTYIISKEKNIFKQNAQWKNDLCIW